MSSRLKDIIRLLLVGPFISTHRQYCNPYSKCVFNNGTWRWIWISSNNYKSLGIGALHGIFVNPSGNNVYRGFMIYPINNHDDLLRFYLGPLIIKNAPMTLEVFGSNKKIYSFKCKCGELFEGDEKELRKHIIDKHAGLEHPSRLELDAFLQSII